MYVARSGNDVVLMLTDENLINIAAGQVMRVTGEDYGEPLTTLYLLQYTGSRDGTLDVLRKHGIDVDSGVGGNGGGQHGGYFSPVLAALTAMLAVVVSICGACLALAE